MRTKRLTRMAPAIPVHRVTPDGVTLPTSATVYPRKSDPPGTPGELYCECGLMSPAEQWGSGGAPNEVGPRCPGCGIQYAISANAESDDSEAQRPNCLQCGEPLRLDTSLDCAAWVPACACFDRAAPTRGVGDEVATVERHAPEVGTESTEPPQPAEPEPTVPPEPEPVQVFIDANGLLVHAKSEEVQRLTSEWLELELRFEMLKDQFAQAKADYQKDKAGAVKRVREIRNELNSIKLGVTEPPGSGESDQKPPPRQGELPFGGSP